MELFIRRILNLAVTTAISGILAELDQFSIEIDKRLKEKQSEASHYKCASNSKKAANEVTFDTELLEHYLRNSENGKVLETLANAVSLQQKLCSNDDKDYGKKKSGEVDVNDDSYLNDVISQEDNDEEDIASKLIGDITANKSDFNEAVFKTPASSDTSKVLQSNQIFNEDNSSCFNKLKISKCYSQINKENNSKIKNQSLTQIDKRNILLSSPHMAVNDTQSNSSLPLEEDDQHNTYTEDNSNDVYDKHTLNELQTFTKAMSDSSCSYASPIPRLHSRKILDRHCSSGEDTEVKMSIVDNTDSAVSNSHKILNSQEYAQCSPMILPHNNNNDPLDLNKQDLNSSLDANNSNSAHTNEKEQLDNKPRYSRYCDKSFNNNNIAPTYSFDSSYDPFLYDAAAHNTNESQLTNDLILGGHGLSTQNILSLAKPCRRTNFPDKSEVINKEATGCCSAVDHQPVGLINTVSIDNSNCTKINEEQSMSNNTYQVFADKFSKDTFHKTDPFNNIISTSSQGILFNPYADPASNSEFCAEKQIPSFDADTCETNTNNEDVVPSEAFSKISSQISSKVITCDGATSKCDLDTTFQCEPNLSDIFPAVNHLSNEQIHIENSDHASCDDNANLAKPSHTRQTIQSHLNSDHSNTNNPDTVDILHLTHNDRDSPENYSMDVNDDGHSIKTVPISQTTHSSQSSKIINTPSSTTTPHPLLPSTAASSQPTSHTNTSGRRKRGGRKRRQKRLAKNRSSFGIVSLALYHLLFLS